MEGTLGFLDTGVGADNLTPDLFRARLSALSERAAGQAALLTLQEASDFAACVEEISRTVDYLQLLAAGAVDRTRRLANTAASYGSANNAATAADTAATYTAAADDGYRNTVEFLRARLRISAAEARRRLALSEDVLPTSAMGGQLLPPRRAELSGAVAAATVSSRSASIVALALDRVRLKTDPDSLARMEHALTRTAADYDPDFLGRIARRWTDALDQDGAEPSEELLQQLQGAFIRRTRHGLHHIEIFATADQYEHLVTVMNTATNPRNRHEPGPDGAAAQDGPLPDPEGPALDRRSRSQQLLDGLVGACKVALAGGILPASGGLRPQVMVTIDYRDLFARYLADAGGSATDTGTGAGGSVTGTGTGTGTMLFGGPINASTVRKLACDADIIPVVLGGAGRVLDIGRASRVFPPHIRKAITARDQGCAFPGCTIPAPWCEAHHISYWSRGGSTGTGNGTLLCSHHHHLIHKEQWEIHVRDEIPWFIPPPHIDPRRRPRRNHYFMPYPA